MKKFALILLVLLPLLWASFASPQTAFGATITVDNFTDEITTNGQCSLREAVQNANDNAATFPDCVAGAGASDTIVFSGSGTIVFTLGEINVNTTIIIDGGGDVDLDGNLAGRLFRLGSSNSNLTLDNLSIFNGEVTVGSGGAILADGPGSDLTITNSNVYNNTAQNDGGAILSNGSVTIFNSVFETNDAGNNGGAIYFASNDGALTITTSLFNQNTAGANDLTDGSGGAIYHDGNTLGLSTITGSLFTANSVVQADDNDGGGAIYHTDGVLVITASAFSGNSANGDFARGGAIYSTSTTTAPSQYDYLGNFIDIGGLVVIGSNFGEFLGIPIPPITILGTDVSSFLGTPNTVTSTNADSGGGAIYNAGFMSIFGSSFVGNTSSRHGGAIFNDASITDNTFFGDDAIIVNSTFANNSATNNGGAIYHNRSDNLLELFNLTIANNSAASGGGIFNNGDGDNPGVSNFDDVLVSNLLLANNTGGNCGGNSLSDNTASGNHVAFGTGCVINDLAGNPITPITADPLLASPQLIFSLPSLLTIALPLNNGSSASGTGDNSICLAFPVLTLDQQGNPLPTFIRPQGAPACDIGAYESDQVAPQEINVRDGGDTVDILDGATPPIGSNGTDFGTTTVGVPAPQNFIIQNTGGANLNLTAIVPPAGFTVGAFPATVAPNSEITIQVTCTAATAGTFSGDLVIQNNDSDENPYNFAITCLVEGPEITVTGLGGNNVANGSAASLVNGSDFNTISQGSPLTRTFTIENTGVNLNLDVNSIGFVGAGTGFSLTLPTLPDSIAPTNTITFDVTCLATSAGLFTETITIANNDSNENPFTFAIRCNVTASGPQIEVFGNSSPINDGGGNSPALLNDTDFGAVGIGSVQQRTYTIENNGNADLDISGTIVSGAGFSLFTAPPATIAAGDSATFVVACDTSALASHIGGVTITNNTSAPTDSYTFNLACLVADPDLRVSKAENTDPVNAGSPIIYTVIIENTGTPNVDATAVVLTEVLPAGFTATAITPSQGLCPATPLTGTFNCNIGTMGASDTVSVVITGSYDPSTPAGSATNEAYVNYTGFTTGSSGTDADGDDERAIETTTIAVNADVGVDKTVDNPTPIETGTIVYTIVVENFGPSTATGVNLTDSLPMGVSGVSATGLGCTFVAPNLSCPIGTMLPGATFTATITATVDVGAGGLSQPISNTAFITSTSLDTNGSNDNEGADITVVPAVPEINLRNGANTLDIPTGTVANGADGTDFGTTTVGTPIDRTFIIQNTGTADLTISIDPLPAGFIQFGAPPLTTIPGGSSTNLNIRCEATSASLFAGIVTIPNNDSNENPYTFEIRCQVNDAPEINVQGNGVDIANLDFAPSPADDTDFGSTIIGTPITNTFTIQNLGSQNLTITGSVTVADPINFSVMLQPAATIGTGVGNTSTFDVRCTAVANGIFTTRVTIPNDDSDENPYQFDVTCTVGLPAPIIEVRGLGNVIVDGVIAPNLVDGTLFPTTSPGAPVSRTFEIRNTGTGNLTVSISGTPLPVPFTLTTAPTSPVVNGTPTTFTIECDPPANGSYPLTITIDNNDTTTPGANPFTFGIECVATTAGAPEINVRGNGVSIGNNDPSPDLADFTDFGSTSVGIPITRTFTIENTGLGDLTLGLITVPAGFTITGMPASPVTSGGSTTLGITCDATAQSTYSGNVSIVNDDSDENPYNFAIRCVVNPAGTNADLSLSKIVSDTTPQFGDIITYTVTVNNVGPGATTGVQVVDTFPTSVTFLAFTPPSQGTVTVDGSNLFLTWDIGTMANPANVTLTYTVQVNPTVGTTNNYAEITASTAPDPNSTPNNGIPPTPIEDDEAAIAFLFDPPFGDKAFVYDGVSVVTWTIVWVNPSTQPIPVEMSDPLLGGTTFLAGSLSCTTPGTTTITTCLHNAVTNTIEFTGIIDPNPGATIADVNTASNRLIITYSVIVPDGVDSVSNTATLTQNGDNPVTVTETFTRTGTQPTPPPTTGGTPPLTAEEINAKVTALPATGETPLWADLLRVGLMTGVALGGAGALWMLRRRRASA